MIQIKNVLSFVRKNILIKTVKKRQIMENY